MDICFHFSRSGIAGSDGNSIYNLLRTYQNAFHNGSPTLHSYQQCVRVPISPRLCQHLLFSLFGFNYSHPSRCKMVSEYSFDLHVPNDPDAGRVWEQEEKGTTEDEMAGWHH